MSRGQSVMLDFLLAAFVFSVVFSAVMLSLRNVQETFDAEERRWRIQRGAIQAADVLVKSRGVPFNWNERETRLPGLKSMGRSLESGKLSAFEGLDYEETKEMLGLEGLEYRVEVKGNETSMSMGRPESGDLRVASTRVALHNGEPVFLKVTVWEGKG